MDELLQRIAALETKFENFATSASCDAACDDTQFNRRFLEALDATCSNRLSKAHLGDGSSITPSRLRKGLGANDMMEVVHIPVSSPVQDDGDSTALPSACVEVAPARDDNSFSMGDMIAHASVQTSPVPTICTRDAWTQSEAVATRPHIAHDYSGGDCDTAAGRSASTCESGGQLADDAGSDMHPTAVHLDAAEDEASDDTNPGYADETAGQSEPNRLCEGLENDTLVRIVYEELRRLDGLRFETTSLAKFALIRLANASLCSRIQAINVVNEIFAEIGRTLDEQTLEQCCSAISNAHMFLP